MSLSCLAILNGVALFVSRNDEIAFLNLACFLYVQTSKRNRDIKNENELTKHTLSPIILHPAGESESNSGEEKITREFYAQWSSARRNFPPPPSSHYCLGAWERG